MGPIYKERMDEMFIFDKGSGTSLYEQLYAQFREQILSGNIVAGQRLPATRKLASEYRLSRNTVLNAYRQLEVEGYIRAAAGSGYYVEDLSCLKLDLPKRDAPPAAPERTEKLYDHIFSYGDLDYDCYDSRAWRKCVWNAYDSLSAEDSITYGELQGSSRLRHILSGHLYLSRGVKCSADQIIFTSGHQQSMDIIANLFDLTDWSAAMEDPGYSGTRQILEQNGLHITPVPVETDGISADAVQDLFHTLLCITPSHQFPLGSVLPISKRLRLLKWAEHNDGYIIEDDYDSELRYHDRPIPSLQSIDPNDRTIYLGTFSKSLAPDLRIAYIVLPAHLLASYREKYRCVNCTVPALLQRALAEYIESGGYQRHINAMRTHYRKKHDYIRKYVRDALSGRAALLGEDAGLHFVLSIRTDRKQEELIELFAQKRIQIYPTEPFWIDKARCPPDQLLLGFGAIPLAQLPKAMKSLSGVIDQIFLRYPPHN